MYHIYLSIYLSTTSSLIGDSPPDYLNRYLMINSISPSIYPLSLIVASNITSPFAILEVDVFDENKTTSDEFIGRVTIPLGEIADQKSSNE